MNKKYRATHNFIPLIFWLGLIQILLWLQHLDDIWELLDVDGSGYLDYGEFIRGVIGEMSESRKALVRKVS